MPYDNSNSGLLGKNDRMRPDKKDPPYNGSCEIHCPHCARNFEMWISAWVNVAGPQSKNPGRKFFGLKFKPKEDRTSAPPQSRMSSQPTAKPTPKPADEPLPTEINPPDDPEASQVPF
jgi:hypothetical protein